MKNILAVFATLLVTFCVATATGSERLKVTYESALKMARLNAPSLRIAIMSAELAETRLGSASVWRHNPAVSIESGPRFSEETAVDLELGLHQKLVFGKLGPRENVARAMRDVAEHRVSDETRLVVAQTARAFVNLLAANARVALAEQNVQLQTELQRIAAIRTKVGDTGGLDSSIATLSTSRAQAVLSRLTVGQIEAEATLCFLIGLEPDTEFSIEGLLEDIAPIQPSSVDTRSDILLANAQIAVAEARQELAKRQRIPEFGLGIVAGVEEQTTIIKGVFEFTLPIFARGQGSLLEASTEKAASRERADIVTARSRIEMRTARRKVAVLEAAVTAFRKHGLQAANKTVAIATTSYKTGAIPLLDLLALQRERMAADEELIKLLLLAAEARIEFQSATGFPKSP